MLLFKSFTILIIGFVLLIKGADFFVEGSSAVAKRLRIPSMIIGMTIVAMGTSLPETAVSPVLLVMGLCSAASNLFSGCLAEKGGLKPLPVFFAAQVLLFAVLPLLLVNRWLGLTGLFAMGLLMYLLNTPVQVHSLGLAEAEYPAAASLCASVQPVSYNFGIAVGSFAGSLVQDAWGLRLLGVPAAVFALLSLWQCKGH